MKPAIPGQIPSVAEMLAEIRGPKVRPEALLAELEGLLRNRPTPGDVYARSDDAIGWIGRAAAVLGHWENARASAILIIAEGELSSGNMALVGQGHHRLVALLNEARHSIQMTTAGPMNFAVSDGKPFEYFDELRKIVERAAVELLFVDPYLDADFVSRYLPFAPVGVGIRLLAGEKKLGALLPAVDVFAKQSGAKITVRSTQKIHDRYVFVDGKECFQSGASFKDGAVKAATTLTQITDAFPAMLQTYEALWGAGKVER
jgi:hypothetical protein